MEGQRTEGGIGGLKLRRKRKGAAAGMNREGRSVCVGGMGMVELDASRGCSMHENETKADSALETDGARPSRSDEELAGKYVEEREGERRRRRRVCIGGRGMQRPCVRARR